MNITINDQLIDYTLENESTLGDVIIAIEQWLGEAGMQLRSVVSDGASLDLTTKESWNERSVTDVEEVDVQAVTPVEFYAEKLRSLHEYFKTLRDATPEESEILESLLAERSAVCELLESVVGRESAEAYLRASEPGIDTEYTEARVFAGEIVPVIEDRYLEVQAPAENLKAAIPALRESIAALADVAAYLQNGEVSKAMTRVLRFLELAQKLMRVVSLLRRHDGSGLSDLHIDGAPLPEFQGHLKEQLSELSDAISDGDTITIGDLLEYEIGPGLEQLIDAIEDGDLLD